MNIEYLKEANSLNGAIREKEAIILNLEKDRDLLEKSGYIGCSIEVRINSMNTRTIKFSPERKDLLKSMNDRIWEENERLKVLKMKFDRL